MSSSQLFIAQERSSPYWKATKKSQEPQAEPQAELQAEPQAEPQAPKEPKAAPKRKAKAGPNEHVPGGYTMLYRWLMMI